MRIAVGGIHTECSTYSPVLMQTDDFAVMRGDALIASSYFAFLADFPATIAPLLHARAVPGGPVSSATYAAFKAEFLTRLKAEMPFDAVYLAMHGAMFVEGMFDAEGDWISAVRAVVGPDMLIAVSYDLHGNLSQDIVDQIDIFAAYRTAPHIDVTETMSTAYAMLLRALDTGQRPGVVRVPVPVLLPGERSSTQDAPAMGLYAALPSFEAPDVWRSDLMIGYVWADEPRATACAVVTGTTPAAAQTAACAIARAFWAARDRFQFGTTTGPLDDMLAIAKTVNARPVILADSGDNPTGGGVGDRADVLAALVAQDWQDALIAGITDRPAVDACFGAGIGAAVSLEIGASLDPSGGRITVTAQVLTLFNGALENERQAVVQIGGITVILAARRRPYHNIADFTVLDLDPTSVALLVVKSGYLSPELSPIAACSLMALTDGVVNQDIAQLPNLHRAKGTVPFDTCERFDPVAFPSRRFCGS